MAQVELKVTAREELGKGSSRKTRKIGAIPCVVYGKGKKNFHLTLNPDSLKKALKIGGGVNTLLTLLEEGSKQFGKKTVIVKEIFKNPLNSHYTHVDFYELDLKKTVTVKVPLHFVGKAEGLTQGGIVQPIMREIEVKCLPHEIPSFIDVDVTALKVGDSLHLSNLKTSSQGKGYEIVFTSDETVVTVAIPKEEVVEAPKAEAAAAAPGATPSEGKEGAAAPEGAQPKAGTAAPEGAPKKKEEGKK
ncbi:MAG: hypothetical protein A2Z91_03075 [Deltaproteobacteria bacterium GWA2_38_16]|nr:MAG: hypothetical protein A2Z91_03075 [Deltaproteobacteria bacterium GWA2_38_16]OGQ02868.1 MAG: hypothetical protein A3D19_06500 [Deltaproteobacteria bacterium RIFCSPHIGHO2_02_FULL_38_15]OGQ61685.1 MAG: hypothetical protein A3G92_05775 [Deltaproteobacteria bacterium RIFCSPLOWO2_12_FULL_38_8]HBQ21714.1 50S ribosomal protein L25 [Deltaproteobacteria bacterium]